MNFDSVEKIARAVLYEGYILYPYRPSSTKNRQRWNFGTFYPRTWAELQRPSEPCRMVTECVVLANPDTKLDVKVRFLQFLPAQEKNPEADGSWEPGVERWAEKNDLLVTDLAQGGVSFALEFHETQAMPALRPLSGSLSISSDVSDGGVCKLRLELLNSTTVSNPDTSSRAPMLLQSMISAHLLLGVRNGEFVSLLDPPPSFSAAAAQCKNSGAFPVMVGQEGERSMMLSSPIILYDYPQIAPESTGDFFDGTEMDEMLALRVMTLTDEEKSMMRKGDEEARRILERTETLPAEHLMKMHGAIRGMRPIRLDAQEDEP